jgi:hypothetical protein
MNARHNLKVAILLGDHSLDTLYRARALGEALQCAKPLQHKVGDIVFGLPDSVPRLWKENARFLSDKLDNATVRRTSWERVLSDNVQRMFEHLRLPVSLQGIERVALPRDWGTNFLDCNRWIVLEATTCLGVYPARPTAVFCADLAQRRAPDAYAESIHAPFWKDQAAAFRLWRQSSIVIAHDMLTAQDLLSYAGVPPEKICHMEQPLDCAIRAGVQRAPLENNNLLIRLEPDERYCSEMVFHGLQQYRDEGGSLRPVFAVEVPTEAIGAKSNLPQVVHLPDRLREMLNDTRVERISTPNYWSRLLRQHNRVWLPREHGGDGQALRHALRAGVRALCPDTLVNRNAQRHAGGSAIFYKARGASDIADTLHDFAQSERASSASASTIEIDKQRLAIAVGFILDRLQENADA